MKKRGIGSPAIISVAGVMLILAALGSWIIAPSFLRDLDLKCYDVFLKNHHRTEKNPMPVIVDIDEKSLGRYGQWPWPRYRIGTLIRAIGISKPNVIGLDILFNEPDRTSPLRLQRSFKKELNLDIEFSGLPHEFMDHDQIMAGAMKKNPTVLGFFFRFDPQRGQADKEPFLKRMPYRIRSKPLGNPEKKDIIHPGLIVRFHATGVNAPIRSLGQAAVNCGFINALPNSDGILRHMPMVISYNDALYPSLSLAVLQVLKKNSVMTIQPGSTGATLIFPSENTLSIPLDSSGKMLIHYRGKGKLYPYYSASDVLDNRLPQGVFKNKIVLVGSSASGLKDVHATPFDPEYIGVQAHAATLDTILTRDFLSIPPWGRVVEAFIIIAAGTLLTLLLAYGKMIHSVPALFFICAGSYWGSQFLFSRTYIFISPVGVLGSSIIFFSILALLKLMGMERDKAFLKNAFSQFVAKPIVDQVVSSPGKLKLEGEEKRLSILFVDIRKFTSMSEGLEPEQATRLLQDYFTPMTRIITQNKGTIDKFLGDGIMAFWNAPVDIKDHEKLAFQSAVSMLSALGNLNENFSRQYGFEINIGIGLHVGRVRVGNMGTQDLFNYTIIGDNVNVTSRLESLSKFYGVRILFSEEMKPHVPDTHMIQELDLVRMKGRKKPLRIYGLFKGQVFKHPKQHLDIYHNALYLYRTREFEKAGRIFSQLRNGTYDRDLYQIYQKRCEYFMDHPPHHDWDGVFIHQNK